MRIVDCLQKQKYLLFLPGQTEESPRYKIQLEIVWGFWAERCEAHQSKSSFMFLWDQSQPSQAQPEQLCLCQTIPLLTLLHFRKPQIKCERGATGGMIPRVCGEEKLMYGAPTQSWSISLWLVEAAKSHDGWIFQHVPNLCSLDGKKWAPALCRMTNHHA